MPLVVVQRNHVPASQGPRTFSGHACVQTSLTLFIQSMHRTEHRGFIMVPALHVLSVSGRGRSKQGRIIQGAITWVL